MRFNDLSVSEIEACIENNLVDYCFDLARRYNSFLLNERGIRAVRTAPHFWADFILQVDWDEQDLRQSIGYVKKQMKNADYPETWLVGPRSKPDFLEDLLVANGFKIWDQWIGMALDLTDFNDSFSGPEGLTIRIVDSITTLGTWVAIAGEGLFGGKEVDVNLFGNLLGKPNVRYYLAFFHNKPVATSMLYLSSGTAGIYIVSTLTEYRKLGRNTAHSCTAT
ncbi:MAG: hypothetical protein IBX71_03945 [Candidatus Desulforudis sp.]|nr:hypothetical protein [Desulforudis sp.]